MIDYDSQIVQWKGRHARRLRHVSPAMRADLKAALQQRGGSSLLLRVHSA